MGVESYMHQFAKETFAGWLRELARETDDEGCTIPWFHRTSFYSVSWMSNCGAPNFGVWVEYPSSDIYGLSPAWDEFDLHMRNNDGISPTWIKESRPPTRDECATVGYRAEFVFDIAVQHKRSIAYGFEIVHKNGLSESKIEKIKRACTSQDTLIMVYTIPAKWVLSQVRRPETFVGERVL